MAEAAAAFYAVETVLEGAAVGAFAVSRSTTPLHIRFRKLDTQTRFPWNPTLGHSLNVIKGKAYIFGGDVLNSKPDAAMRIAILPSDIRNGELDYQTVEVMIDNNRPLEQYTSREADSRGLEDASVTAASERAEPTSEIPPRALHTATSIGSDIFVLSGRHPQTLSTTNKPSRQHDTQLFDCDVVYRFSTQSNKWSVLQVDAKNCKDGIPQPRTGASSTSTAHPQPDSAVDVTASSHGTIFLHGGYDAQSQPLRDTWTFDVNSRTWSRLPDLPDPLPEEIAGEGRILCINHRVWRAGDGFGRMMYFDFEVIQEDVVNEISGPHPTESRVSVRDKKWTILSFGDKAADTALLGEIGAASEKTLINKAERLPVPRRGAGFVPARLSAGRLFLLYFMGQDGPESSLGDVWSFQIKAEDRSPAAIKDAVRSTVGKNTGEHEWAVCDIIESTKEEGQVHPPRGLTGFDVDNWADLGGGNAVIWGGLNTDGFPASQCWIMTVE